jgi:hypothetical protein
MHLFFCKILTTFCSTLVCYVFLLMISDLKNVGVHVSMYLATSILAFGSG